MQIKMSQDNKIKAFYYYKINLFISSLIPNVFPISFHTVFFIPIFLYSSKFFHTRINIYILRNFHNKTVFIASRRHVVCVCVTCRALDESYWLQHTENARATSCSVSSIQLRMRHLILGVALNAWRVFYRRFSAIENVHMTSLRQHNSTTQFWWAEYCMVRYDVEK